MLTRDRRELFDRIANASRGLCMHQSNDVRTFPLQLIAQSLWIDSSSPLDVNATNL